MVDIRNVIHGVEILGFEVSGSLITVDVYGGVKSPISGSLFYNLEDPGRRAKQVKMLDRWLATGEPLTYVMGESELGVLMETGEFLERYADEM